MLKPLPPRPARGIGIARWSAAFALVAMAEAVLARRFDLIDTPTLFATLLAVLLAAVIGLSALAVALSDVWRDGAPGGARAVFTLFLVLLTLTPFAGAAAGMLLYPPVYDVSTDTADPPRFRARPPVPEPLIGLSAGASEASRLIAEAFPEVIPRRVPLSTVEAHAAAHLAIVELGWTITAETAPARESDAGVLEAEARALFLGLPDDVVIRILPSGAGSRVDVRSASRFPAHDLGENARRIRAFFEKLDEITTRPAVG